MKATLMANAAALPILFGALAVGCATKPDKDWQARAANGSYTFDMAVLELGMPDQMVTRADGTQEADWLLRRGTPGTGPQAVWHRPDISTAGSTRNTLLGPHWKKAAPATPDRVLHLTFAPDSTLTAVEKTTR
ncbi:MAG TPA: hypothetical protein PKE47_02495 [Verrucomicrobiota bacterium]|nr:hypothetical protein [Verrucomicrobiota bacterium]